MGDVRMPTLSSTFDAVTNTDRLAVAVDLLISGAHAFVGVIL